METLPIAGPRASDMPSRMRVSAQLLILASIGFVVLIIFTPTILLSRFPGGFDKMTPRQMVTFGPHYIVFHLLALAAITSGAAGLVLLAAALRETRARTWASLTLVVACASIGLGLVVVIARLSLLRFNEATLDQNSTWHWTTWVFSYLSPPTLAVATFAACMALFRSGMLRRLGLSIELFSAILLILTIAVFPPFVFALLWLPLGIGLLRPAPAAQPR